MLFIFHPKVKDSDKGDKWHKWQHDCIMTKHSTFPKEKNMNFTQTYYHLISILVVHVTKFTFNNILTNFIPQNITKYMLKKMGSNTEKYTSFLKTHH